MEFQEYVRQRRLALFRFAVVLTGDTVLADDVVTDVLRVAYEKWTQVSAATNVHAYVRRMVVNEYLGWRREASLTILLSSNPVETASTPHAVRETVRGRREYWHPSSAENETAGLTVDLGGVYLDVWCTDVATREAQLAAVAESVTVAPGSDDLNTWLKGKTWLDASKALPIGG